jgi:hypothetical protein
MPSGCRTNLPLARRGPDILGALFRRSWNEKKIGRPFVRWPERRPSGPDRQPRPPRPPRPDRPAPLPRAASCWRAAGQLEGQTLAANRTRWPRPGPHGGPRASARAGQPRSCCCRAPAWGRSHSRFPAIRERSGTRAGKPGCAASWPAAAVPRSSSAATHGGSPPACMPHPGPQRHYLSVQPPEAAGMMWREWRMMRGPSPTLPSPPPLVSDPPWLNPFYLLAAARGAERGRRGKRGGGGGLPTRRMGSWRFF